MYFCLGAKYKYIKLPPKNHNFLYFLKIVQKIDPKIVQQNCTILGVIVMPVPLSYLLIAAEFEVNFYTIIQKVYREAAFVIPQ